MLESVWIIDIEKQQQKQQAVVEKQKGCCYMLRDRGMSSRISFPYIYGLDSNRQPKQTSTPKPQQVQKGLSVDTNPHLGSKNSPNLKEIQTFTTPSNFPLSSPLSNRSSLAADAMLPKESLLCFRCNGLDEVVFGVSGTWSRSADCPASRSISAAGVDVRGP